VLPKWEGYKLVSQIRGFFTERTLSENRLRTTDKESDSLGKLDAVRSGQTRFHDSPSAMNSVLSDNRY
jgi:hypothetical protein